MYTTEKYAGICVYCNTEIIFYCKTYKRACTVLVIRLDVFKMSIHLKWALLNFQKLAAALNGDPIRNLKGDVLCLTQTCRDLKRQNFIKQAPCCIFFNIEFQFNYFQPLNHFTFIFLSFKLIYETMALINVIRNLIAMYTKFYLIDICLSPCQ